jgi:hypothetical protein
VVLVDESGSESAYNVQQEVQAAETIAQDGLNGRSRVSVVGFGSNNGLPGQQAATQVCRPTVIGSAPARQYLADCVRGLHARTPAEGQDTDFAAAMAQAMSYFTGSSPAGALKAIFIETDGVLDVHNSPQYGQIPADRNTQAQQYLNRELAAAKAAGVQVWPLGFGSQVDLGSLAAFASGGSQGGCVKPRPQIVTSSSDIVRSLEELFASATCGGLSPWATGKLPGGQSIVLHVPIPAIATDGTITVDKGDPGVSVTYKDPNGVLVSTGKYDGSQLVLSGTDTRTESLNITNPVTGTWQITLTAPSGLAQQLVSAAALWQGAVRASVFPEPPSVSVGQHMVVRLTLLTRTGAVTDGATLKGMSFSVIATGDGLPGPVTIPLNDNGVYPDATAGDGSFAGTFTAPRSPGSLTLTGRVTGYGLYSTPIPVTVQVTAARALIEGSIGFPASSLTVNPGQIVRGTLTAVNRTGEARRVRLILDTPAATHATIVSPRGVLSLPSGNSTTSFIISFTRNTALGGTSLSVQLVDNAHTGVVYGGGQLNINVQKSPGAVERYKWIAVGILVALLALVAFFLARRRGRRARFNVRGLYASLSRHGEQVGAELRAPSKWADEFRFVIRDGDGQYPRLDNPRADDHPYVARRGANGRVRVRTPEGERYEISLGGQGEALTNDLLLTFRDSHRRRSPIRPRPSAELSPVQATPPSPLAQRSPGAEPDPWL